MVLLPQNPDYHLYRLHLYELHSQIFKLEKHLVHLHRLLQGKTAQLSPFLILHPLLPLCMLGRIAGMHPHARVPYPNHNSPNLVRSISLNLNHLLPLYHNLVQKYRKMRNLRLVSLRPIYLQ